MGQGTVGRCLPYESTKTLVGWGRDLGPHLRLINVTGRYWHEIGAFNVTGKDLGSKFETLSPQS